jgi:hypothetical protein
MDIETGKSYVDTGRSVGDQSDRGLKHESMNTRQRPRRGPTAALIASAVALVAVAGAAYLAPHRADQAPPSGPDASTAPAPPAAPVSVKRSIPYADAKPILDAHRSELPAELAAASAGQIEAAWSAWVSRHDAEIRARLERGDEDSIVNLWLYGTSFTTRPRVTAPDMARSGGGASAEDIIQARLDDLVAGVASPGTNERLQFVRETLLRHGIDPATAAGRDHAQRYLSAAALRMAAENDRYHREEQSATALDDSRRLAAFATMFRDRGLSSDTRLPIEFALEQALADAKAKGKLDPGSVRRVAIVGPGLDFSDKAEGYDFYPQQTIQPFALIDSLVRLGLATPNDLRITTLDLSPRVNQHLAGALERARGGGPYVLQVPLAVDEPARQWQPDLVTYWQRFGDRIGDELTAIPVPAGAGSVRVRAVRVRPDVVLSITPEDVNIVLERLEPRAADERFDLIVATNILVYYDAFEQSLALSNVSTMLRPGGFFVTNYAVFPSAPMERSASLVTKVEHTWQHSGDTLFWYARR